MEKSGWIKKQYESLLNEIQNGVGGGASHGNRILYESNLNSRVTVL